MNVGEKAPDFTLPDENAQKICLKDFFGNWIILYFYPRDNTPGCTLEATHFSNKIGEFEDLRAQVIGISPDSVKSHHNFCRKHKLKITLLSDRDKEVLKKYNVWRKKKMYGREVEGVIRSTFLINPGGNIVYIWDNVRVKGHVDEVLEVLKHHKKKKK